MSERLAEIQRQVGDSRRRLEALARRLAAARARLRPAPSSNAAPPPLFDDLGATPGGLDELELHFEVLDSEDPGREG